MCTEADEPSVEYMTTIRISMESSLPPDRFVFAARDFSARRVDVFPAVRAEHFAVHEQAGASADVTEGTPAGIGINWERCRYDWSEPGRVVATVTESNVYASPGSAWELTAGPAPHGSHVEMRWIRSFRRTPRGLIFGALFRIVGRPIFRGYARTVLTNIESLEHASPAA
jgi:hypothetical protein